MRCLLKRGNIPRHGSNGASLLILVLSRPQSYGAAEPTDSQ
jgi:hypothetical protein